MNTILKIMKKSGMKFKGFMFLYLLASIIVAGVMVLINMFQGYLAETALYSDTTAMRNYLILITGLVVIRLLFSGLRTFFRLRKVAKAEYNLRNHFIDHFLRAPFSKVIKTGSGEVLSVYSNDIEDTALLIVSNIAFVLEGTATFVASIIFLQTTSSMNIGILILVLIGLILIVVLLQQPMMYFMKKSSEETAKFNAVVNDSLQNLSVVAAYNLEAVVEDRYMTAYKKYMSVMKKVSLASIAMVVITFIALFGPLAGINIVLAFRVIEGSLTIPGFIAYNATLFMAVSGLSEIANSVGSIVANTARAKRVIENTATEDEEITGGSEIEVANSPNITFNNVSFSYDDTGVDENAKTKKKGGLKISFGSKPTAEINIDVANDSQKEPIYALNDVSFNIKAGSKVAFVGESGSGKSTVLKILLGLYNIEHGEVIIGGYDISLFSKENLRKISSYVPQDSFLFPESIGENITLEKEISNSKKLEKACADAGILEFIQSLPNGFDSILAQSSENISGGQKQRIAMARALYKDAPVILFDEATSALDASTEASIINSLTTAAADKTVIMVTHRTKPIAMCDTIVVMKAGKIVGIGTHEELINSNEVYRKLEVEHND